MHTVLKYCLALSTTAVRVCVSNWAACVISVSGGLPRNDTHGHNSHTDNITRMLYTLPKEMLFARWSVIGVAINGTNSRSKICSEGQLDASQLVMIFFFFFLTTHCIRGHLLVHHSPSTVFQETQLNTWKSVVAKLGGGWIPKFGAPLTAKQTGKMITLWLWLNDDTHKSTANV